MSDFIVSFVGLPSSGKSSIINSLVLKRLLHSGIYRTTTEFKLIEDIFDDNNNKFKIYDLPEIYNSEEKNIFDDDNNTFKLYDSSETHNLEEKDNNKINNFKHILNSNLIIWTSDANNAFLTTHEINEYNKLKKYIKDSTDLTGKLYYVIIMLTKYDKKINLIEESNNNNEIQDSDEDIDIKNLIINVKNKFPEEDIILYNAYGRSYHNEKSSSILKKFIEKRIGIPTNFNILFDISKYILNFSDKQERLYFDKFITCYNNNYSYLFTQNIMPYWLNITNDQQVNHLMKIRYDKFNSNYFIFKFINLVINNNKDYIKIINLKLIDFYKDIIINNNYSSTLNYHKDYNSDDIIKLFINIFIQSSILDQIEIYTKLFQDDFNYEKAYLIILSIHNEGYKKENFNFINIFNCYIKTLNNSIGINSSSNSSIDNNNISNFYLKILLIINKVPIYIKYYNHTSMCYCMSYPATLNTYILSINKKYNYNISLEEYSLLSLSEKFNNLLIYLNKLNEDNDYILLNKLQIIYILTYNSFTLPETSKNKISFYIHSEAYFLNGKQTTIIDRLKYNDTYLTLVNQIWTKIYSNIQIPYNGYIGNLIPLDLTELLYI